MRYKKTTEFAGLLRSFWKKLSVSSSSFPRMGQNKWRMALVLFGLVSGFATIMNTTGLFRGICLLVSAAIFVLPIITWLLSLRKVPQVHSLDFFPKAPYRILQATKEDIFWIADTAKKVYSGLDIIPPNIMIEWFDSNPTGFSIIKDRNGNRCGNIDILPIKPNTLQRFLSGELVEIEIRGDSILTPEDSDKIQALYVESFVAIDGRDHGNPLAVYKCLMSTPDLISRISNPSQIDKIYAIGASPSGIRLMEHLGFDRINYTGDRRDGHQVFSIDFRDFCNNLLQAADEHDKGKMFNLLRDLGGSSTL